MDKCECLNYVVKNCFIFTDSFIVGSVKLIEIIDEKHNLGIDKIFHSGDRRIVEFEDGEIWTIRSFRNLYGLRWDKCFVDSNSVTIAAHHHIATLANSNVDIEEAMKLFNW